MKILEETFWNGNSEWKNWEWEDRVCVTTKMWNGTVARKDIVKKKLEFSLEEIDNRDWPTT